MLFNPWLEATMMLAIESSGVVALRIAKLSQGGPDASHEAQQMVSEKVLAAFEATNMVLRGESPNAIIARYRDLVGANTLRLNAAPTAESGTTISDVQASDSRNR